MCIMFLKTIQNKVISGPIKKSTNLLKIGWASGALFPIL